MLNNKYTADNLTLSQTTNFRLSNLKGLQTTILNLIKVAERSTEE